MLQVSKTNVTARIPAHGYFVVSAIFHYLGPAFAVLLFSSGSVLGVAWFRIASAAVVFAVWRRSWRIFRGWLLTDVHFGGEPLALYSLLLTVPSSWCTWYLVIGSPRMEVQQALISLAQRCSSRS